ncbi:MAG TPA: PH domain-containing protein [Gaiellaceae bacterium]|nr:PH domain-containing protein [Gaiellaceae bacterium]
MDEQIRLEVRRHGIVLARPLLRSLLLAAVGGATFLGPWPLPVAGAAALALAALLAVGAVWRWDRTQVVLTGEALAVEHGILRRESASVQLRRVGAVEVEQSLLGRLLGYGTIVAGELEVGFVPRPREFAKRL